MVTSGVLPRVGGQAVSYVVPCRYIFLQDDGTEFSVDGEIRIAAVTTYNEAYPSLLGRDILQRFRLTVSLAQGEVNLDPEP